MKIGLLETRLNKLRMLNERGVEYGIVEVNCLRWNIVELNVCLIKVVWN